MTCSLVVVRQRGHGTGQKQHRSCSTCYLSKKITHTHQLVDTWRVFNPTSINFFWPRTVRTRNIEGIGGRHWLYLHLRPCPTHSRHAPLQTTIPMASQRYATLRCSHQEDVKQELKHHFATNITPDSWSVMIWEAHKPGTRGVFIKHGSRLKRAREEHSRALLLKIHQLETNHKHTGDPKFIIELTILREKCKSLALDKNKGHLQKCKKHF